MYQPPSFREADLEVQHALIRAHPLGLLITLGADGPVANLLPFHLVVGGSGKGMLQVHMAKANGQWRGIDGTQVLVVFQGADAYVTPSWYATKQDTGKVVPTWNYTMVQARGTARLVDDAAWLRRQIGALTEAREAMRREPWAVEDAPADFIASQIRGIIGVEIEITGLDGKWKVSQNRPAKDIAGVIGGLGAPDEPHANAAMARLVRERASGD